MAGEFGPTTSIGRAGGIRSYGRPATGISNVLKARSLESLQTVAAQQTQKFIQNGTQVSRGAAGNSFLISKKI